MANANYTYLKTEETRILQALSTLPVINVSEEGRSISNARKQLLEELQLIQEQLALSEDPSFVTSRIV